MFVKRVDAPRQWTASSGTFVLLGVTNGQAECHDRSEAELFKIINSSQTRLRVSPNRDESGQKLFAKGPVLAQCGVSSSPQDSPVGRQDSKRDGTTNLAQSS